jgi:hypothetical protein
MQLAHTFRLKLSVSFAESVLVFSIFIVVDIQHFFPPNAVLWHKFVWP